MALIISEKEDNLGIVTLNDPGRRNCLSSHLVEDNL